jgi:hypothetical protein
MSCAFFFCRAGCILGCSTYFFGREVVMFNPYLLLCMLMRPYLVLFAGSLVLVLPVESKRSSDKQRNS